jgi:hypothetical protein
MLRNLMFITNLNVATVFSATFCRARAEWSAGREADTMVGWLRQPAGSGIYLLIHITLPYIMSR